MLASERYQRIKFSAHQFATRVRGRAVGPTSRKWEALTIEEIKDLLDIAQDALGQFVMLDEMASVEDVRWRDLRNAPVPADRRTTYEEVVPRSARSSIGS